ncbi:hypothetical protein ESCOMM146B1_19265 [Escherichia coli]
MNKSWLEQQVQTEKIKKVQEEGFEGQWNENVR